jgi:sugar lactone lactonase YvrE
MRDGIAAHQRGDYAAFRAGFEAADRLRPGHPGILYNLACGRTLTGDPDGALPLLERLAAMGLSFEAAGDDDLRALRGTDRFDAVVARFAANGLPIARSEVALVLDDRDVLAEGVARDPRSGDLFVGSVRGRRVLRAAPPGGAAVPLPASIDGAAGDGGDASLYGVMGMAIDPERRILWAAASAVPEMDGFGEADRGRAMVARYDLDSGRLVAIIRPPDDGAGHLFGDLTVHRSGDLYVSDSGAAAIHLVRAGETEMETWAGTGEYDALQGIAFSPDGGRLFVADYSRGLLAIEPEGRRVAPLPCPDDVAATGIDGLYFHGADSLIAIQNGVRPHRVVRFRLDPSLRRVVAAEVLEANHPRFDEPTLGTIAGDALLYVANSQWGRFAPGADESLVAGRMPPVILRLPL